MADAAVAPLPPLCRCACLYCPDKKNLEILQRPCSTCGKVNPNERKMACYRCNWNNPQPFFCQGPCMYIIYPTNTGSAVTCWGICAKCAEKEKLKLSQQGVTTTK